MTPRLEACYFQERHIPHWGKLARVLRASAARHCRGWRVRVEAFVPADIKNGNGPRTFASNTQKLERWASIVTAAADGDRILLIDADTVILRSLDDIWERPFDVAYTMAERFPVNGGVVFVRVSDRSRRFMAAWVEKNRALLFDYTHRPTWRTRFGGINQAAFCLLTEGGTDACDLLGLPCAEWNCEDSTWAKFDPAVTRILHVKSELRLACLGQSCPPEFEPLVSAWRTAAKASERPLVEA